MVTLARDIPFELHKSYLCSFKLKRRKKAKQYTKQIITEPSTICYCLSVNSRFIRNNLYMFIYVVRVKKPLNKWIISFILVNINSLNSM